MCELSLLAHWYDVQPASEATYIDGLARSRLMSPDRCLAGVDPHTHTTPSKNQEGILCTGAEFSPGIPQTVQCFTCGEEKVCHVAEHTSQQRPKEI
eukprot:343946-Amphidinium_carterae.1